MVQGRNVNVKIWLYAYIVREIALLVLITNVFHLERVKLSLWTLSRDVKKQSSVIINNFY